MPGRVPRVVVRMSESVSRDDARRNTQALEADPLLLVAQCLPRLHARLLRTHGPPPSIAVAGAERPVPWTPASRTDDREAIPLGMVRVSTRSGRRTAGAPSEPRTIAHLGGRGFRAQKHHVYLAT